MSLVKRGSPKKMVAIDPVTKYRRPILSRASTTKWSSSDCSMGEPPRHFLLKALRIPVRVLGREMAGDHGSGGAEEVARDLQALGSGHGAEDIRHVIVHHLDISRVDHHSRIIPRPEGTAPPPMAASPPRPCRAKSHVRGIAALQAASAD